MGQIYGKAESCSIWLGEGDYGTEIFMELVEALRALPASENTYKGRKEKMRTLIEVEAHPSDSHKAHLRLAVRVLLDRSWFQRAWVFQECALSKNVDFMLGSTVISFDDLVNVVQAVLALEYEKWGYRPILSKTTKGYDPLDMMETQRNKQSLKTNRQFLMFLAESIGEFQATDSRDFVYAFLGLMQDPDGLLKPDYSLSLREVFTLTIRVFIERSQVLDVLNLVSGVEYSSARDLPSWAVDWSGEGRNITLCNPKRWTEFRASVNSKYILNPECANPARLRVHGKVIDIIKWMSTHAHEKYYYLDPSRKFLNLDGIHDELISNLPEDTPTADLTRERLLKVLLADQAWQHSNPDRPKDYLTVLNAYDRWPEAMAAKNLLEAEQQGFGEIPADIWALQQCSLVAQEKRVARCEKGKLALVLRGPLPGDSVCIIMGSKTPMVLRTVEGAGKAQQWNFVGQCYYEGVMYGEAIQPKEAADPYYLF
jgi:hypothetical protein